MLRKVLIGIMMVLLPSMILAQSAGGQIRRSVKKQQTSTSAKKRETSEKENSGKTKISSKPIIKRLIANMVFVEGGSYVMEEPLANFEDHLVTIPSFYIGKYEVTQDEWQAIMGNNPSEQKGVNHPVENVSWNDCQDFINRLNEITGKKFRLPTDEEWVFAAKGGNRSKNYKHAGSNDLSEVATLYDSWDMKHYSHNAVGKKKPNELGIYDMSGNVAEACQDWADEKQKIYRGETSFREKQKKSHLSYIFRLYIYPDERSYYTGLRLALSID